MEYSEEIYLFGLRQARLHFVENPGMAFGITLGAKWGKIALSVFRILAAGFLVHYLRLLLRDRASWGLILGFGLILAGAIGNIIDSSFYGLIFSGSSPHAGGTATLFPPEGGYAGFLQGNVVDMLYFPIATGTFSPDSWIWPGQPYIFFRPVFNIADVSIVVGVLYVIWCYFLQLGRRKQPKETSTVSEDTIALPDSPNT